MAQRFTILLVIPHLGGGGAERVMAHLARYLPNARFRVHLALLTSSHYGHQKLPLSVSVHHIDARRVLFGAFRLVRLVRAIRPHLILSGMFHLNFMVLLLRPFFPRGTRILVRQNGMLFADPDCFPSRRLPTWINHVLYRVTYPRADGIICQTSAMAAEMHRLLGANADIHVLKNPVDVQSIRSAGAHPALRSIGDGPHLLAVGRLAREKGFDLLLNAFAAVRIEFHSAQLTILGDGIELSSLQSQCKSLKLGSCVRFAGYVSDPATWFTGATLLVVPSRHEGLPNALLEGAAAGLPIVATPCCAGVIELLHGASGTWLTRDISSDALARSLKAALATLRLGERFRHPWLDSYDLKPAVGEYEKLILQTLAAGAVESLAGC